VYFVGASISRVVCARGLNNCHRGLIIYGGGGGKKGSFGGRLLSGVFPFKMEGHGGKSFMLEGVGGGGAEDWEMSALAERSLRRKPERRGK